VFSDSTFVISFANENVAADFYQITARGTGTTVDWTLGSISSANPNNSRWDLTLDSEVGSFTDTNSVWNGGRNMILSPNSSLNGTSIINCNKLYQSGATLSNCSIIAANTSAGIAFIESNSPENISNCSFEFSSGHAIELTSAIATAFTFSNNTFSNYGVSGSTDAAIYNNSGKNIVINVSNGDTPTIRNGTGANTTVNNSIVLSLTNIISDSEVRIYSAGTVNELAGQESVTGGTFEYAYNYIAETYVDIVIFKKDYKFNEPTGRLSSFLLGSTNTAIPINQQFDRNYFNPD